MQGFCIFAFRIKTLLIMNKLLIPIFILCAFGFFASCSNDLDVNRFIPKIIDLSTHEIGFSEETDSVAVTAAISWYIGYIYNESTKEYVYKISPDNKTKTIGKGALRGSEFKINGLTIREYNDHHAEFLDDGMLPTDTFTVCCQYTPMGYRPEFITITKRKD